MTEIESKKFHEMVGRISVVLEQFSTEYALEYVQQDKDWTDEQKTEHVKMSLLSVLRVLQYHKYLLTGIIVSSFRDVSVEQILSVCKEAENLALEHLQKDGLVPKEVVETVQR